MLSPSLQQTERVGESAGIMCVLGDFCGRGLEVVPGGGHGCVSGE